MTAALIAIGVIAFLAFDAYVLYRVFAGRRKAGEYGSFAVPGEISVVLPAGKAKIDYQEGYKASSSGDSIDFGVPGQLQVTVTSPDGEAMAIKGPGFRGMGSVLSTGSNWSRARVGTIEVTAPGSHTVSAQGELPDAVQPQVLIGP